MTTGSTAIPCLRYDDAPAAIDWLCRVFGFERGLVVDNGHGGIAHAQLTLGGGMVMLGSSSNDNAYGKQVTSPRSVGGAQTQTTYLVVDDADAVYAKVQGSGARVVMPIQDEDYGGRGFSCFDPEGHLWSVGTYDPWATSGSDHLGM